MKSGDRTVVCAGLTSTSSCSEVCCSSMPRRASCLLALRLLPQLHLVLLLCGDLALPLLEGIT